MVPHFVEDGGTNQDKLYQEREEEGGHGGECFSKEITEVFFLPAFVMMFIYQYSEMLSQRRGVPILMTGLFFLFHDLRELVYRLLNDGKDPDDDVVRDQVKQTKLGQRWELDNVCILYASDAADE